MTERIGKCIVHKNVVYDTVVNKSAFVKPKSGNSYVFILYEKNNQKFLQIQVKASDCLFIFEDDIDEYPEYFI